MVPALATCKCNGARSTGRHRDWPMAINTRAEQSRAVGWEGALLIARHPHA